MPEVAAIISAATIDVQAPAIEIRMPTRMPGSAARNCTCSSVCRREAPSTRPARTRSGGTSSRAATVAIVMIGTMPNAISTSLGSSPMPNQTISAGMNASGGSGLVSSMSGSMS